MSFVNLLHQLPTNLKSMVRNLESINQKIIKTNWSIVFNNVCLNENIMPKYTNMTIFLKETKAKKSPTALLT